MARISEIAVEISCSVWTLVQESELRWATATDGKGDALHASLGTVLELRRSTRRGEGC